MSALEDFGRVCRVCLLQSDKMYNLKIKPFRKEPTVTIADALKEILPPDKGLFQVFQFFKYTTPEEICIGCLKELNISYQFEKKCIRANQEILAILKTKKAKPVACKNNTNRQISPTSPAAEDMEIVLQWSDSDSDKIGGEDDLIIVECEPNNQFHQLYIVENRECQEEILDDAIETVADNLGKAGETEDAMARKPKLESSKHIQTASKNLNKDIATEKVMSNRSSGKLKNRIQTVDMNAGKANESDATIAETSSSNLVNLEDISNRSISQSKAVAEKVKRGRIVSKSKTKRRRIKTSKNVKYNWDIDKLANQTFKICKTFSIPIEPGLPFSAKYNDCKLCHRYFQHKFQLELHYKKFHPKTKVKDVQNSSTNAAIITLQQKSCSAVFAMEKANDKKTIPINCEQCPSKFRMYENFVKHMSELHGSEILYNCSECDEMFLDQKQLDSHLQTHKIGQQYKIAFNCKQCAAKFYDSASLEQHSYKEHVAPYIDSFSCELCSAIMHDETEFNSHIEQHKLELQNLDQIYKRKNTFIKCSFCGVKVRQKYLKFHFEQHRKKPHLISCKYCTNKFKNIAELRNHMKIHQSLIADQTCQTCGKTLISKEKFRQHILSHSVEGKTIKHNSAKRRLACELCDKTFNFQSALKLHQSEHIVETNYSCPECLEYFENASDLEKHKLQHEALEEILKQDANSVESGSAEKAHKLIEMKDQRETMEVTPNELDADAELKHQRETTTADAEFEEKEEPMEEFHLLEQSSDDEKSVESIKIQARKDLLKQRNEIEALINIIEL